MPSLKGDQRDIIRRFHAADDKARNECQKSILLTYLAQLRGKASFRLIEQSHRLIDHAYRGREKAAAAHAGK